MKHATLLLVLLIASLIFPIDLMSQSNATYNTFISLYKQNNPYKNLKDRPRMPQAPITNLLCMDDCSFYVYPEAGISSVCICLYDEEGNIKWTNSENTQDCDIVTIPYPADLNGVFLVELQLDDDTYTGRIELD